MAVENQAGQGRLLETLERLLESPSADLRAALASASDLVSQALRADKVDIFIYDPARDSLLAGGTSHQPLSASQKQHGLDVLAISNGGRAVHAFKTGETHLTGRLEEDPEELRGIREVLQIRSQISVPLDVNGRRRGVLMIASLQPDFYTREDARFAETCARWLGMVIHRAELVEEIARTSTEQGRRAAADELVTTLAHDLRNYLSPIDLRVKLLRRRAQSDRRESDVRDLDLAQRGLDRLGAIISEMLDVARIDQGVLPIQPEATDVEALVKDVAATMARPDKQILVNASEEVVVAADPSRLRQCVENLLSNAIDYTPDDGSVTVEIRREAGREGPMARIDVVDEGPGIAPEVMARLFERFVRAKPGKGGLGLGLYLAKRIAVLHGGDLTVESRPGKGARFRLLLRCMPEA